MAENEEMASEQFYSPLREFCALDSGLLLVRKADSYTFSIELEANLLHVTTLDSGLLLVTNADSYTCSIQLEACSMTTCGNA